MLVDLGKYEPFGKNFIEERSYLVKDCTENPTIDFSAISIGRATPTLPAPFFRLFNVFDEIEQSKAVAHTVNPSAIDLEQEIYVHGTTVVWSRAGYVVKTMDYSSELQPIQKVLFAQFPAITFKSTIDNQFTVTMTEADMEEMDMHETVENESSLSVNYDNLCRALCVVFKDYIKICTEDKHTITCQIPFEIGEVTPLDVGLIVSQNYVVKPNKKGKTKTAFSSFLKPSTVTTVTPVTPLRRAPSELYELSSSFVTITNPLKEACPVISKDVNSVGISTLPEPFSDPQKVLFATAEVSDTGRLPVIVTLNMKDKKHYIWTYDRRKNKSILSEKTRDFSPSPLISRKRPLQDDLVDSSTRKRQKSISGVKDHFYEGYSSKDDIDLEDVKERDLYNELLDPSEISIRLLWRETLGKKESTKLKNEEHIESSAFLVHGLKGQEMICIMNYALKSLQLINLDKATYSINKCVELKTSALFAIPIYATRDRHIDLLYMNNENKLQLFIDKSFNYSITQPTSPSDAIPHKLLDPLHDKFSIQYSNDEIYRYQLNLKPQSVMVRDCLLAVDCGSINHFPCIWSRFIDICFFSQQELNTLSTPDHEWKSFFIALLSSLAIRRRKKRSYLERKKRRLSYKISSASNSYLSDDTPIPTKWIERAIELSDTSDSPKLPLPAFVEIVHNLHVIYEEYRIKKPTFMHAKILGYLLLQCAVLLRSDDWIRYYENHGLQTELVHSLEVADEDIRENMTEPASIQACLQEITPKNSSKPTLLRSFGVNTLEPALYYYANTYARTTKSLWTIYGALYDTASDAVSLLNRIVSEGVTRHAIDMLEESISAPILDVLNKFKSHPAFDWPKEAYILIGRNDIYKQLEAKVVVCDPNIDTFKLASREAYEHVASLDELMKDQVALNDECVYKSDIMDMQTEQFRFGFDGLVKKVRIMLDASRIPEHHVSERTDLSDDELTIEHQEQVLIIAQRTLALAAGRGIYAFGTHIPDLTKVLPFETIVLSAKILPLRTIVALESEYITSDMLIWPQFHNGVAAGLRIAPNNEIDDSWINFCSPAELTPEHGGMLLAMGLNGALKRLPFGHWVRFFSHTYEPVSLGFILGAAVAYRGTRHSKVTKILSVHIPSLLPDGGHSFNYSNMIIATSLLGMGLVYSKSCDRLMVTVMLQELGKNAYSDPSTLSPDYESCALAAGFALGFITLGSGNRLEALEDLQLRNRLYNLMSGRFVTATHGQHQQEYLQEDTDVPEMNASKDHLMNLDVTSPGATIALGLMYLKTENKRVADHVDILETRPYLNYVRPDFLLIRVVAKNLIMWSTIMPTDTWIESQLPDFIVHPSAEEQEQHVKLDEEVSKQAMYNIICGSCLCLGLRYAGSKNKEALDVLLSRLDSFMKLSTLPDTTPQKRVTKCIIRTCIDVVCTAAAMVMAGSGDQQVFARLQQLYSRTTSEVSYGSHMAVSMALGLLFVGLGGYTLKTTDEAIAGLLCAFYPFYPVNTEDNRYHLQVFRHLWVLAVDSRWLIPFDVDHRQPCRLPMYLELYDDNGRASNVERRVYQMRIEAPSVVPDYSLIKSVRLDSNRYWPLFVDEKAGEYRESIIRSGIIYVKRKDGKLSYEEDPCGRSSLDM